MINKNNNRFLPTEKQVTKMGLPRAIFKAKIKNDNGNYLIKPYPNKNKLVGSKALTAEWYFIPVSLDEDNDEYMLVDPNSTWGVIKKHNNDGIILAPVLLDNNVGSPDLWRWKLVRKSTNKPNDFQFVSNWEKEKTLSLFYGYGKELNLEVRSGIEPFNDNRFNWTIEVTGKIGLGDFSDHKTHSQSEVNKIIKAELQKEAKEGALENVSRDVITGLDVLPCISFNNSGGNSFNSYIQRALDNIARFPYYYVTTMEYYSQAHNSQGASKLVYEVCNTFMKTDVEEFERKTSESTTESMSTENGSGYEYTKAIEITRKNSESSAKGGSKCTELTFPAVKKGGTVYLYLSNLKIEVDRFNTITRGIERVGPVTYLGANVNYFCYIEDNL